MTETAYERLPSLNEQEVQKQEKRGTLFIYSLVFCVCISGFLFGYDTGGVLSDEYLSTCFKKKTSANVHFT
jgi:hypothetical protein